MEHSPQILPDVAMTQESLNRYTELVEQCDSAGPSIDAFEDIFEQARHTIVEPHEQELFDTAVAIQRWNIWGKPGDPLPNGLAIEVNELGRNTLTYSFPFGEKQDTDALEALFDARLGYALFDLDGVRYQARDRLEAALRELEYKAPSVAFLYNIVATESTIASVHDSHAEQIRNMQARDKVRNVTGVDVYSNAFASPSDRYSAKFTDARRRYMRLTEFSDPPEKNIVTRTYSLEDTREKLITWLTTIDESAPAIAQAAYDGYELPDYLNNPLSRDANLELSLLLTRAQRTLDGPFPFPQNMDLFESVTTSLLTKGKGNIYREGGLTWEDISQHFDTWESYISQRAENYLTGVANDDELLKGMRSQDRDSRQLLLALKAPEVTNTQNERLLVVKPLGSPEDVRLRRRSYSSHIDSETITFLPQEFSEKQSNRPVGMIIECRRPTWPQVRRLIESDKIRDRDPQLPLSSDDADIALFIQQKNFVSPGEVPVIAGFNLIAANHDLQRYYFAYDEQYDPYVHDKTLQPDMTKKISEAADMLGMPGLSAAIETEDALTYRGLSELVQRFSFHGYPGKDIVQDSQALVARAKNLDDLKKFVNKEGIFCGQCTGGARLFQLLVNAGRAWNDPITQARVGHVWDGSSEMVMAIGHQQTSVDMGYTLIDTSLTFQKDASNNFVLKAASPGKGISLGASEAALGLQNNSDDVYVTTEKPIDSSKMKASRSKPPNISSPKARPGVSTRPNIDYQLSPTSGHTDILESSQSVSISDKARAVLARKRLAQIGAHEARVALELGIQTLFAAEIDINKAQEAASRSEIAMSNSVHLFAQNGLDAMRSALRERYSISKRYKQGYYSENVQSHLIASAKDARPREADLLRQAAYILHFVEIADKDPFNF